MHQVWALNVFAVLLLLDWRKPVLMLGSHECEHISPFFMKCCLFDVLYQQSGIKRHVTIIAMLQCMHAVAF